MLIAVIIGLVIGWTIGNEVRRRKNAEQKVDHLRSLVKHPGPPALERQLKRMHGTLNDMYKLILAVSKAPKTAP
jgi:hypothetical protein